MKRFVNLALAGALTVALAAVVCLSARAGTTPVVQAGLVTQDAVSLRAAPRESAASQTVLWRGEALEIRAERGDYLQVWDHQRERGGYVQRSQVLRVDPSESAAPELLALLAFVSEQPGSETLGLALAAAAIQALPASDWNGPAGAAVLDAIGRQAERLGERASRGALRTRDQAALTAHLDVARHYGVTFRSVEAGERVRLCYDGDADRRLLALPSASAAQRVRAALALTRDECQDSRARADEREAADRARADLLDLADGPGVPAQWRARLSMRQASVWSRLAYARAQRAETGPAREAAERALQAVARVNRDDLDDDDRARYTEAALRVNAVRWAAGPAPATGTRLAVTTRTGDDGQTCVTLNDARKGKKAVAPLVERCSWGVVWAGSASVNREGNALALAVQPLDGWRELWVFRQTAEGWTVQVLPPAALNPGIGYAELAGWVPGGRQMLVAREALAEGRQIRRFEVVDLRTLIPQRSAFTPDALGPFVRWPDPAWKRESLALR